MSAPPPMPGPRLFGLAGWSGAGKTTLMERLLPAIAARGFSASTVKHTHHDVELDHESKDSWRHRAAGAREVMLAAGKRWFLVHEYGDEPEMDLAALTARMTPVDVILVEGFRFGPHPRLEVYRPELGKPRLDDRDRLVAVASSAPLPDETLPVLPLDDAQAIAAFILGHLGLERPR